MDYLKEYHKWCTEEVFDKETKKELEAIKNNEDEIKDRFYKELEFGTAGLRGIIGAGTNRMNQYTVGKATQGLANFIKKEKGEERGVVISYDSRKMSPEFSKETALILNANGIKTYLFDSLRPVPELSFAVRELKCIAGIMITASHNPPKYNGYKVYWEDGAQIVSPKDKQIIEEVRKVTDYKEIKKISEEQATAEGLFHIIGEEIDEKYQEVLRKLVLNPEIVKKQGKELKIVYTPLHGTGNIPVRTILKSLGFENVMVVPEQELPDGNFPTVSYPNPEDPKAFTLALKLAKKENADVILATDPDADRLGVYAKDSKTGEYRSFTGNMSGLLIAEYELSQRKEQNKLPQNGVLIKTIVSSNLADAIAKYYNVELIEVLTGFKYIGEQMRIFEETNSHTYLFGFEESYGCLVGTHARDKDAIVAVMALCEAAAYYKEQGLTLWDQMIKIYEKYGFYKEGLLSITLEGADGAQKIKEMLENMRSHPITKIGDSKVTKFRDYEKGIIKDIETGKEEETTLPKSNVLYYDLEEDAWCCVRPSGTEPKIKFYMGVKGTSMEDAENKLNILTDFMKKLANQ
ncbi:MAG TPA: phospho-sugar mutase [Candidatus Merdicola faecigallinarum]|uniref:Phosphoglucomutase n=1 Tax=Candidatus Merdicola faecigallinarum TaxID=2840862 RepID=A0A9D1M0I2_9FIRM|nr:phospho-sugar mutase [Candidatus Merdicola faecigallinarum]